MHLGKIEKTIQPTIWQIKYFKTIKAHKKVK